MLASIRGIRAAVAGFVALSASCAAIGQMNQLRLAVSPVALDSRPQDNDGDQSRIVFSQIVQAPGAAWMRLVFQTAKLPPGSRIHVQSYEDGEEQWLTSESLAEWQGTTAFFNGQALLVELEAAPGTKGNHIAFSGVLTGNQPGGMESRRVCDAADTRVGAADARVARLLSVPLPLPTCAGGVTCDVSAGLCSGFQIDTPLADDANDRLLLTAGHCLEAAGLNNAGGTLCTIAQFEAVPETSTFTCAMRHPPVAKQFPIKTGRTRNSTPGGCSGNDWGVFTCGKNSLNQTVFQSQGEGFALAAVAPASGVNISKIGYGADGPSSARFCDCVPGTPESAKYGTQQTSAGTVTDPVGGNFILKHNAHTCGGDSGCAITRLDGRIVAIHTGGGCNPQPSPPLNCGTSILNPLLEAAMAAVAGSAVPRNDSCASPVPVLAGATVFTTLGATTDGPREALVNNAGSDQIDKDIWFAYTATFSATTVFSVCSSDYDTRIAVYSLAPGVCPLAPNTAIAANDDNPSCMPTTRSLLSVPAVSGQTYLVRIGGYANQTGTGTLRILVNDDCTLFNQLIAGAAVPNGFVSDGPNLVSSRGFTTTSTGGAGDPFADGGCLAGANMIQDAWFIYGNGPAGTYRFDTCAFTNFDSCISVYRAQIPPAANGAAPNCRLFGGARLGADDDACGAPAFGSRVDVVLNANDLVLVRLGSSVAGQSGEAVLTITMLPPANDNCAGAAVIAANVPTPFSNLSATDSAAGNPSCGQCFRDLWYRYDNGANAGRMTADTCGPGASPADFDTIVAVYDNDCNVLAQNACNDDGQCGLQSRTSWMAAANTSYLIRVCSARATAAGSGTLVVTGPVAMGPQNDECANSFWAIEGPQPFTTVDATTDLANPAANPAVCLTAGSNSNIERDVWYKYRSTRRGNLIVDACDAPFDARLAGYLGTACPPAAGAIACGDDNCGVPALAPRMNLPVTGTAAAPNDFTIRLGAYYFRPVPPAPDPNADASANAPTGEGTLTLRFIGNDSCATVNVNNTPAGNGANAFDTTGANSDGPVFPAGGGGGCVAGQDISRDLWFLYSPGATGNATFTVCAAFNSSIAVYVATVACPPNPPAGCDATNAAVVGCGKRSSVTVGVLATRLYWVRVGGTTPGDFGPGVLTITPPSSIPDNDQCFNSAPIYLGDTPYTTAGATTDGPNPEGCLTAGANQVLGRDIWYTHTATADGTLLIDSCDSTFDNRIAVYAPGAPNPCTLAGALACGDDDCGVNGWRAQVRVTVTKGNQYLIRVGGYGPGAMPVDGDIATGTGTLKLRMLPGDRCANAPQIFVGTTYFDSTGADTDGLADPSCALFPAGDGQITGDLWYIFDAPASGRLVVDTLGSTFDTRIALYTMGLGFACPPGVPAACNDDFAAPDRWSRVGATVLIGSRTMIRVGGFQGAEGPGRLNVKLITNDACARATVVGNGLFAFDTIGATQDGTATCGNSSTTPDVWYRWTATCSGDLVAHTCDADYDTALSVYTGGCGALAEVGCNDDAVEGPCGVPGGRQSFARTPVTAGTMYWIRVSGYNGATGTGRLSIACEDTGACCNGAACTLTRPSECTGDHKRFVGSGAACNAPGNDVAPCCKADFSQNGAQAVSDVFDFLNAWFAGDPGADADGNGAITVLDIFAFITQWFNGCP